MSKLFSKNLSNNVEFELFSNIVLKFTAILMVIMVLLAINVGERLDQIISTNRFSGGLARPQLYIGAYQRINHKINYKRKTWDIDGEFLFLLESPSLFDANTSVENGKTVSKTKGETFSGQTVLTAHEVLSVLSGIDPGFININGQQTPFVVANFSKKKLVDIGNNNVEIKPSIDFADHFLKIWSPYYINQTYPNRSFSEFKNTKTKIYIETKETSPDFPYHIISIGGLGFSVPEALKSGELDFLTGLSSTNTEVIYLGELSYDEKNRTSTISDILNKIGFKDAAQQYLRYKYPGENERIRAKKQFELFPAWNEFPDDQRNNSIKEFDNKSALAQKSYEEGRIGAAYRNYLNTKIEESIKDNTVPSKEYLPFQIAYPDAWQKYIEFRLKANPTPPPWLFDEFLGPLGFDKRVMLIND